MDSLRHAPHALSHCFFAAVRKAEIQLEEQVACQAPSGSCIMLRWGGTVLECLKDRAAQRASGTALLLLGY